MLSASCYIADSAEIHMAKITIQDAGLDLAYEDTGPRDGTVVLLLHGWPDDATTWTVVASQLNDVGFRTVIPTLRGFGESRFIEPTALRSGNSGVLCLDVIALVDALGVERFSVAGHDWGSKMAEALAVGWPDRVRSIAMLSSPPRLGGISTPSFEQAQRQWYHWFQATNLGVKAISDDRKGFARIMWRNWAPDGWFEPSTFNQVARSFENPDWVSVTIHSYRSRWGEAELDPRSLWLDEKVRSTKTLSLPMLYIQGEVDGVNPPSVSETVGLKFTGPFERLVLPGVGHFPTREKPTVVAKKLIEHFSLYP